MAAEIIQINPQSLASQTYNGQDTSLLTSFDVNTSLSSSSYIEYFIYDNNQTLLSEDYTFTEYTILADGQSAGNGGDVSQIIIDLEASLINSGFDQGEYISYFNFFNKQIGSNLQQLYITEISSDRTEIRLDSISLTNADIVEQANNLIQQRENSPYFLDFYLNFGENNLAIANNIQLDVTDPNNPTILIKLYEALSEEFDINSTLWVVTLVEEPIAYKVTFEDEIFTVLDTTPVKGPNFNLDLKDQVNNSTISYDYATLTSTSLTSSQNQLRSLLEEKEIDINIDYTDFNNFIHFSSAQTRLENFYYKVSLIEQYSASIATLNNTTNSPVNISSSKAIYENQISDIITNFDGYDYYLYYSSGSWAWPKTTNQPPYQLATTGSNAVLTWLGSANEGDPYYGGVSLSASQYDNLNQNNLFFAIPEYLREDPANEQYQLFVEMVGQFYDNIWIYYKDVTEKYNADNRLENGVSKDIVADAIRDFGIKLYQNNFSNDDLYTAFLGLTPEGGLFPFPNITGSLPTPSGYEYVNTLISASNDYMPLDDVNKSLYKRIYHNLPYLLKAKGTIPGLRALITSYGIPDTILRINEYGGKDKSNVNDWDYWQNEFNYTFTTTGSNFITTPWNSINPSWNSPDTTPSTLAFRFKTNGLPSTNIPYSQSLWRKGNDVHLVLKYTGSGYTSGSYSGSIVDPYNQYALLDFYPNYTTAPNESSSLYLPFFDGGWWTVMINRDEGTSNFTLSAANKIYEGGDNGTLLGFYSTSSITAAVDSDWYQNGNSYFASSSTVNGLTYKPFSGSIQEIRYYNVKVSEESFKDFTMNPYSIEGNSLNSSPDQLIFRLPLGGELYTGSISIHPKITGSWVATSSFEVGSSASFASTPTFVPNTEYFFYDQPAVGIKNAVSDKIRLENDTLPSGDTLSAIRALSQQPSISSSYTPNTNLLEVAFSPQDEINEDIMDQIGYFNIGELIGDPRLRSSSATSYPDLDNLRNEYFEKYTKNYDLVDYIRLIKFFDNSLFKMIKDFVPARTSLASGIVIKQTLLERNKYPQPQVNTYSNIANVGVDNLSSAFLIPGNDTVSASISYPITSSGIYSLSITGSITEDASDSQYYIELYDPSATLLAILWSDASTPFATIAFNGSYTGNVPSGSYIYFSADPGAGTFQINNFTASLQLINSYYAPYTTQDISVSGTVAPQWNDYQPGTIENFSGGTGGTMDIFNGINTSPYGPNGTGPQNIFGITQSWYESVPTISGSVLVFHDNQDEFYDGEFSGSRIIVTTQSLNTPYPLENAILNYKHVYYFATGSNEQNVFQNNFLDANTSPAPGEILFLCVVKTGRPFNGTFYSNPTINTCYVTHIKVAKTDCNGNDTTFPLGQTSKILIYNPPFDQYVEYNVTVANELPNCYLYESTFYPWVLIDQIGGYAGSKDAQLFDYYVSSSITSPYNLGNGSPRTIDSWNTSQGNLAHYGTPYFNTSSGLFTFENTPNTPLQLSASISISASDSLPTSYPLNIMQLRNGVATSVSQIFYSSHGSATYNLSTTLYPTQGDQYYISLNKAVSGVMVRIMSASLYTSQIRNNFYLDGVYAAPLTSSCSSVIIEPYITVPNYYNSDNNPIINNVEDARLSTIYDDVDYSTGITTPTNFALLISGSAVKAPVQDSNYSSKRIINPRYDGSKSTSQYLNVWTPGDTGTYGKLPSVESLKNAVAYCDNISGWPAERMNASALFIKYLIKSDGTIVIPNTTPNSLADNKGIFETGENIEIQYKTVGGQASPMRKVIRGGSRIEPILYSQYGQAPNAIWNTTMSFSDIDPTNNIAINNYTSLFKRTADTSNFQSDGTQNTVSFTNAVYGSSLLSGGGYIVTSGAIADGISLTFNIRLVIRHQTIYADYSSNFTDTIYLYKGSTLVAQYSNPLTAYNIGEESTISMNYNVPTSQLSVGDIYTIKVSSTSDTPPFEYIRIEPTGDNNEYGVTTQWNTSQYPSYTLPVTSSGVNSIWNWGNKANYPYVITSSQTTLVNLFGDPNVKMADLTGSDFNTVQLPWSIKYGDEFRFEGSEDFVYQVGKVFNPADSGSGRIFQTGSIEIHFNKPLPISASTSVFNMDHFLIRRYVDDATTAIIEGFKPNNSTGPYIVKPEFVVPELNKSVDQFILDLTQKGLL
jgi:hypothetical protein